MKEYVHYAQVYKHNNIAIGLCVIQTQLQVGSWICEQINTFSTRYGWLGCIVLSAKVGLDLDDMLKNALYVTTQVGCS